MICCFFANNSGSAPSIGLWRLSKLVKVWDWIHGVSLLSVIDIAMLSIVSTFALIWLLQSSVTQVDRSCWIVLSKKIFHMMLQRVIGKRFVSSSLGNRLLLWLGRDVIEEINWVVCSVKCTPTLCAVVNLLRLRQLIQSLCSPSLLSLSFVYRSILLVVRVLSVTVLGLSSFIAWRRLLRLSYEHFYSILLAFIDARLVNYYLVIWISLNLVIFLVLSTLICDHFKSWNDLRSFPWTCIIQLWPIDQNEIPITHWADLSLKILARSTFLPLQFFIWYGGHHIIFIVRFSCISIWRSGAHIVKLQDSCI